MRFFSVILFLAMAAVLPVAGLQQYFCTMNMEFVQGADDCPETPQDCCKKSDKHRPETPDCMIAAKVLPNADTATPLQVPSFDGAWALLPAVVFEFAPVWRLELVSPAIERGPPDCSRLYLVQQRLLI